MNKRKKQIQELPTDEWEERQAYLAFLDRKAKLEPTSKLYGWDWIKSLMKPCEKCGEVPNLGTPALGKKWRVCCMNICCNNFREVQDDNPFLAIEKWNKGEKNE